MTDNHTHHFNHMRIDLEFFVWKDGKEQGPFSSASLHTAMRLGSIAPETPVWTNQDPTWRSVAEMLKTLPLNEGVTEQELPHVSTAPASLPSGRSILKSGNESSIQSHQLKIGLAVVAGFGLILILLVSRISLNSSSNSQEPQRPEGAKTHNEDNNGDPALPRDPEVSDLRIAVTIDEAEKCVLMARSGDSSGTAFIAVDKGKRYVYTNVHVASYRNLEFSDFRGQTVSVSPKGEVVGVRVGTNQEPGIDIVRFPLISSTDYALRFASRTTIEKRPHVWTLGDSGGESILKTLPGSIKGVGPSKIEVDCEFIQGNSGGPIVTSSGEVCGIASYMTTNQTIWAKGTEQEVRRMAWIPGTNHLWTNTSLDQLEDERLLVENCLNTSAILWILLNLQTADSGFLIPEDFPEEPEEVEDFLAAVSPHPLIDFDRISKSLAELKKSGKSSHEMQHSEFVRFFDKCSDYQEFQLDEAERKVRSSFWGKSLHLRTEDHKELLDLFKNKSAKFRESGQVGDILIKTNL
jgi:S1-C subfamily serine protease